MRKPLMMGLGVACWLACISCVPLYGPHALEQANRAPLEVTCEPFYQDGVPFIRMKVTNNSRQTIHMVEGWDLPFTLIDDDGSIVIASAVIKPRRCEIHGAILPPSGTTSLRPGKRVFYVVPLVPFNDVNLAGSCSDRRLLKGNHQVYCKVGWRNQKFLGWQYTESNFEQHIVTVGPVSIDIP